MGINKPSSANGHWHCKTSAIGIMATLEENFKAAATAKNIKPGELQLPLRIMLVGGKFGPPVFVIAAMIGKEETIKRIGNALSQLS